MISLPIAFLRLAKQTNNDTTGEKAMENKTLIFIALSLAAALAGCVTSEQRTAPKLTNTEHDHRALLHTIEGTKLKEMIHRLHGLKLEGMQDEQEMDSKRREVVSQVMVVAEGAESVLDCILAANPELNLDADKQTQFYSLADNLREEIKTLKTQTQVFQLNDIPATLDRMNATCSSCHELFPNLAIDPDS